MRKESFAQCVKRVQRTSFARGIARTFDIGAGYSRTRIDTSADAAYVAIARDAGKIGRDMTMVIERKSLPTSVREKR